MSALAITCAMLDRVVRRNGQSSFSRRSVASLSPAAASPSASTHCRSAVPTPNQPGNITLDCDHDSTHGIALRSSTLDVCLREDGLDPLLSSPISATGVEVVKYSMNPG